MLTHCETQLTIWREKKIENPYALSLIRDIVLQFIFPQFRYDIVLSRLLKNKKVTWDSNAKQNT